MLLSGKYMPEQEVSIVTDRYPHGDTLCVTLSNGVRLSINVPESALLKDNEFVFKNYSENTGLLESCLKAGIVELTGEKIRTGFVVCPVVRLLV